MGQPRFTQTDNPSPAASTDVGATGPLKRNLDLWALRGALVGASIALCYTLNPFGLQGLPAAGLGFFVAMVILLAELRLRHAEISGLVGGALAPSSVSSRPSSLPSLFPAPPNQNLLSPFSNLSRSLRSHFSAWCLAPAKVFTFLAFQFLQLRRSFQPPICSR